MTKPSVLGITSSGKNIYEPHLGLVKAILKIKKRTASDRDGGRLQASKEIAAHIDRHADFTAQDHMDAEKMFKNHAGYTTSTHGTIKNRRTSVTEALSVAHGMEARQPGWTKSILEKQGTP